MIKNNHKKWTQYGRKHWYLSATNVILVMTAFETFAKYEESYFYILWGLFIMFLDYKIGAILIEGALKYSTEEDKDVIK